MCPSKLARMSQKRFLSRCPFRTVLMFPRKAARRFLRNSPKRSAMKVMMVSKLDHQSNINHEECRCSNVKIGYLK